MPTHLGSLTIYSNRFMISRAQKILIAILLLQIALIGWVYWPENDPVGAGVRLMSDTDFGRVTKIEIENNLGEKIELARDPTANEWVHAPSGYLVTVGKVETFLDDLSQIVTGRLVTQTPASHTRLGVADNQFEAKVSVWVDGVKQEILVGTAPTSQTIHVRIPNQDEVWLTDRLTEDDVDVALRNWMDTLYYSVERSDVVALSIENEAGMLRVVQSEPAGQDADGNRSAAVWGLENGPAGTSFDQAAFGNLLSRATSMRFTEPLGIQPEPSYQLDSPTATIKVELENGKRTLFVGDYDSETDSYVVASDFNMIVRIAGSSLNDLINATAESLILDQPSEN